MPFLGSDYNALVETASPARRAFQFDLRSVLYASLPVAVFLAMLGAVCRHASWTAVWTLFVGTLAAAAVFGLGLFIQYQLRLWARHAAGVELLSLESVKTKRTPVVLSATALLLSLHASIGIVPVTRQGQENLTLVVASVPAVLALFVYALLWFDRFDLEICQRGIILNGLWFRPWREVTGYTWPSDRPAVLELALGHSRHEVAIPPERKTEVDQLLARSANSR